MKTDGSILIDTKIIDGGMEKGFDLIKDEMSSVGITAKQVGKQIELSFSKMDVSKPIANAVSRVRELESQLASVTSDFQVAISEDDDKAAEKMAAKRVAIYEQLESAREKLSIELAHAVQREAVEEEKASQRAIVAAEKEAKEKKRLAEKQFNDLSRPAKRFNTRLREIVSGALVFNLISAGLRKMTTYFSTALKANEEYSASFAQLKGALLTAFQPIYEAILPALLTLMRVLTALVQVVGNFFAAISGKSTAQMAKNAQALNKQSKAIGGVGDAAEEAQKQLMGFDEINRLESNKSAGAGGAGGIVGEMDPNFDPVEITQEMEKILALVGAIGAGLLAWKIASMFTDSLKMAAGIGMAVGGALLYAYMWADAFANGISWDNLAGMVAGAAAAVAGLALAFGTTGAGVVLLVAGVGMVILSLREWIQTGELSNEACAALVMGITAIGAAISLFTGSWIPALIAAVVAFVVAALTKGEEIKAAFDSIIQWLKEKFAKDWTKIFGNDLGTALNILAKACVDIISGLFQLLGGLIDFVRGAFSGDWAMAWYGFVETVRGAVNLVLGVINGMIAALVSAINALFGLLSFNINLPGGGNIGLSLPQFSTPQIPYLAQGAVLPANQPFLAMVGDQKHGTNVEAPLETIKQAVAEVLAQNGSGGDIQINFTGDLAQLAQILYPEIHRVDRDSARAGGW